MSKLWSTITGKTYATSTTRTREKSTFDTTTGAARHHHHHHHYRQHRPFGSFVSAKLKGETRHEHNNITDDTPIHNDRGMAQHRVPPGHHDDETWSNSSQRGGTTPYLGGAPKMTTLLPQHEPESPNFDIEMQMSSGKAVLISRNREQVPMGGAECLRLVDAEQGRREGWLAPAGQVSAGATERAMATARLEMTERSAMSFSAQWCRSPRDTTGHDASGPRRDWIWDGTWRG